MHIADPGMEKRHSLGTGGREVVHQPLEVLRMVEVGSMTEPLKGC
jgi:hypothetical protein